MTDENKELKIEFAPKVLKQMEEDPKLAAAVKEMVANFHQAHDAVQRGQYKTMDEAMEAITGNRPQKYDGDTGEPVEGASMHDDLGLDKDEE